MTVDVDELKRRFVARYPDLWGCIDVRVDDCRRGTRQVVRFFGSEWKLLEARLVDRAFLDAARAGARFGDGPFAERRACRGDFWSDQTVLAVADDGLLRVEFAAWDSASDPRKNFSLAQARREIARIAKRSRRGH